MNYLVTARPVLLSALALLMSGLMSGCGGGGSSSSPTPSAPAAPLSVSKTTPSGLTLTLAEDRATVPIGGSVTYTLTLTNDTSRTISVRLEGGCGYNVSGTISGGVGVFNTSGVNALNPSGGGCGAVGSPANPTPLAPGQSLSGTVVSGNVFSAAGQYMATGGIVDNASSQTESTDAGPLTVIVQ